MGFAMLGILIFSMIGVFLLSTEYDYAGLLFLVVAVCCVAICGTMISIENDCKDLGGFRVANNIYQCAKHGVSHE